MPKLIQVAFALSLLAIATGVAAVPPVAAGSGVICGVLWHQGESGSDKKENAENYEAWLTKMFRDLRADLDSPELPIVVGQLGNFLTPGKCPFAATVRAAIGSIPAALPRVGFADSAGLGDKGDKLHFSTEAQRKLGARYAEAMRGSLEAPTPSAISDSAIVARVALVGDSTVASKSGWGDAFGKLLAADVQCLNMGRGGRSSKSYRTEGHWKKVLAAKPDWVLIQFGHNDAPGKGPERETDAGTTFRENLARYVAEARASGAKPVLVTSLTRRNFNAQGKIDPQHLEPGMDNQTQASTPDFLNDYVEAARAVAAGQGVPLIDLNARSVEQMNRLGLQAAAAFDAKRADKTHLSAKGAGETAKLVADEIRKNVPELARLLKP
jgi:pectinesterase